MTKTDDNFLDFILKFTLKSEPSRIKKILSLLKKLYPILFLLRVLCIVFAIIALARPQTTEVSEDTLKKEGIEVNAHDTLCRQVSNRDTQLKDFSLGFDKIIFVSGTKSSNGNVLYNVCKSNNKNSHFVSSAKEIKNAWFNNNESVGICGATSTPMWLMEDIKSKILTL